MTSELTSEEIVTDLLTSNEIVKRRSGNFYITNAGINLGEFLLNSPQKPVNKKENDSKYTFIKGSWNI